MEKITWTGRMRNEKLQKVKEDMNILHTCTIKRRTANQIGHILYIPLLWFLKFQAYF